MTDNNFYREQKEQSRVKTAIVSKYFDAWSQVMIAVQKKYHNKSQELAYIDLFAGPGKYKDGTVSTPIEILTKAVNNPDLSERLVVIFNDKDKDNANSLKQAINEIPYIEKLRFRPEVHNFEVGDEIVAAFENSKLIPSLLFIDPWGYKGISLRLVNSVVKDWGCDVIFFFNYNRINMGIDNPAVKTHIEALFGIDGAADLIKKTKGASSSARELIIVEELCQALKGNDKRFVLPFRFRDKQGNRTSHHLIFVSKHFRGYEIMKDIMAKESTNDEESIPKFEYNPADKHLQLTLINQLCKPLEDLKEELLRDYRGRVIRLEDLYEEHSVDKPYVLSNYKKVMIELYNDNVIKAVNKNGKQPKKNTFSEKNTIYFPK